MSNINYQRFHRAATRCKELGTGKNTKPIVANVYQNNTQAPLEAFIAAHQTLSQKESAAAKENKEAKAILSAVDVPFRVARATVLAFVPTLDVPATLSAQPTVTDQVLAVESLLDIVDDYVGTPWADEILKGDFGTLAPNVVKEVSEAAEADKDLAAARQARAAAYGPAYEKYIAFKRVVRAQYGASSLEYRRIHLRTTGGNETEEEETPQAEGAEGTGDKPGEK